jgi:hypothetical protein
MIIERCLAVRQPVAGARAATADLELEDYEALFARRTIYTGTRTSDPAAATQPLYQRILGDAWDGLPAELRAMHHSAGAQVAAGQADVLRGRHPLARLVAFAMGFPAAGHQVPVQVAFTPGAGGEHWTHLRWPIVHQCPIGGPRNVGASASRALWTIELRFGAGRRGYQAVPRGPALVAVGPASTAAPGAGGATRMKL